MNFTRLYASCFFGRSVILQQEAKCPFFKSPSKRYFQTSGGKVPLGLTKDKQDVVIRDNASEPCSRAKFSIHHGQRICQYESVRFSSSVSDKKDTVSLEDIFSTWNQHRVQSKLKSVKPIRSIEQFPPRKNTKSSAVLVPLCTVNKEPSIVFTLRSSSVRKHRGEVSFPGGNVDKRDKNVVDTALRETFEEIGIHPRYFHVWGVMQPTINKAGSNVIHPVLAFCGEIDVRTLTINLDEVEEVFTCRIQDLCDKRQIKSTQFRTDPGYTLPVYLGGVHKIWGLSSIILHQTLKLIAPGLYTYELKHIPPINSIKKVK